LEILPNLISCVIVGIYLFLYGFFCGNRLCGLHRHGIC
jgi:hypothetical protein